MRDVWKWEVDSSGPSYFLDAFCQYRSVTICSPQPCGRLSRHPNRSYPSLTYSLSRLREFFRHYDAVIAHHNGFGGECAAVQIIATPQLGMGLLLHLAHLAFVDAACDTRIKKALRYLLKCRLIPRGFGALGKGVEIPDAAVKCVGRDVVHIGFSLHTGGQQDG